MYSIVIDQFRLSWNVDAIDRSCWREQMTQRENTWICIDNTSSFAERSTVASVTVTLAFIEAKAAVNYGDQTMQDEHLRSFPRKDKLVFPAVWPCGMLAERMRLVAERQKYLQASHCRTEIEHCSIGRLGGWSSMVRSVVRFRLSERHLTRISRRRRKAANWVRRDIDWNERKYDGQTETNPDQNNGKICQRIDECSACLLHLVSEKMPCSDCADSCLFLYSIEWNSELTNYFFTMIGHRCVDHFLSLMTV